jgi:predicted nucleic acid-binding protein
MAQDRPEVSAGLALVLDANILLRAVLGVRVRSLIELYAERVTLLTPRSCVEEARKYLPSLCSKRKWDLAPSLELLEAVLTAVEIVENASLAEVEDEAKRRIESRDPDDWPVVALAIALGAPVWTEDPDFFGSGVATWTTKNVEIYLSSEP